MAGYSGMPSARESSEDDLLLAVTQALTLCGWRWMHLRRSDLAIVQGSQGFPDIIAIHEGRGLAMALELKGDRGTPTGEQSAWLRAFARVGIEARVLYPRDLDAILPVITGQVAAPWATSQA